MSEWWSDVRVAVRCQSGGPMSDDNDDNDDDDDNRHIAFLVSLFFLAANSAIS